jgi:predicted nucleotidyltransferase
MTELEKVKNILTQLKPVLTKDFGVDSLGLFGSIVRNDYTAKSDIDIIVDFYKPVGIEFIDLGNFLENSLQKRVDLVSRKGIKEKYYQAIQPEIIYV